MNTRSIWKLRAGIFTTLLAVASLSPASHAQVTITMLRVNVPFAFEYGSHHFAAGRYEIRQTSDQIVSLTGRSTSGAALVQFDSSPASPSGKVVFQRYGNRYFLKQIWSPNREGHLNCFKTKAERQQQKEMALASRETATTTVQLALLQVTR